MINIRFDVACIPLYTCRTSEDFSSSCKACPEWLRCRSTERMQARNSVYESSRSAKCPRLGRANILPDRCQWWWGSEGRAPPEQWFQHFIERSQCRNHRRNRDEKKKWYFRRYSNRNRATLRPPVQNAARLPLRGATRYRSSVDKMSDTSGLKRSDSPRKPNVDSRKIVLSLFTAQPSSIVSLKSCNVLPYRSLSIYRRLYRNPIVRSVRKVKRIRFHFKS